jgi:hypothetical protein
VEISLKRVLNSLNQPKVAKTAKNPRSMAIGNIFLAKAAIVGWNPTKKRPKQPKQNLKQPKPSLSSLKNKVDTKPQARNQFLT